MLRILRRIPRLRKISLNYRIQLERAVKKARGCHVELMRKDIATVRYQPQRLWEWERIAMELVEELAR